MEVNKVKENIMTTLEALEILDHVTSNVAGTRSDHAKIAEALSVLKTALDKK